MEAVVKTVPDKWAKAVVADYERGLTNHVMAYAWQSESCIGEWYKGKLFDQPAITVDTFTECMQLNGEAIYATRRWKVT